MSYTQLTDAGAWDQMLFLSQKTINEGFEHMWQLAQLDDAPSPLKHFSWATRDGQSINAEIGIPSVKLQTNPKDEMLFFHLKMTGGSLYAFLSNNPTDMTHIDWDIHKWEFVFSVSISELIILCVFAQ